MSAQGLSKLGLVVVLVLAGCKEQRPPAGARATRSTPHTGRAPAGRRRSQLTQVLESAEVVRKALAEDALQPAREGAGKLNRALDAAAKSCAARLHRACRPGVGAGAGRRAGGGGVAGAGARLLRASPTQPGGAARRGPDAARGLAGHQVPDDPRPRRVAAEGHGHREPLHGWPDAGLWLRAGLGGRGARGVGPGPTGTPSADPRPPQTPPTRMAARDSEIAFHTCPMHPSIRQEGPGTVPHLRHGPGAGDAGAGGERRAPGGWQPAAADRRGGRTGGAQAAGAPRAHAGAGAGGRDRGGGGDHARRRLRRTGGASRRRRGGRARRLLYTLYSPELVAAQAEWLASLGGSGQGLSAALEPAARQRLKRWGVTERAALPAAQARQAAGASGLPGADLGGGAGQGRRRRRLGERGRAPLPARAALRGVGGGRGLSGGALLGSRGPGLRRSRSPDWAAR